MVLLWLAVLAFVPLAALDLARARHPVSLLRRAGNPRQGFPALGFVADTCVLGTRILHIGPVARLLALILLGCGAAVWIAIAVAEGRTRAGGRAVNARGEWLLAVVATEALAILAGGLASAGYGALRDPAVALWGLGIAIHLVMSALIAVRLVRRPLRQLTPDWWILMGAPAIIAVGATAVHPTAAEPAKVIALAGWAIATAWIPVLVAAELWQARRTGLPRFTPSRWTMVFPLGMYSAASQLTGHVLRWSWMAALGRWWMVVALGAWGAVALGELHHALLPRPA